MYNHTNLKITHVINDAESKYVNTNAKLTFCLF